MREYARISPRFWVGETGRKIKACGRDAQLIALYLLTSPHSNMIGLYWLPISYIANETGISLQGADKALVSLIEAGFCEYDKYTEVVWVREMARYQIADKLNPKDKQSKGVQNAYNEVPANPFLMSFFSFYSEAFCMELARGYEGASEILGSKEKEKEKEKEKDKAQEKAAEPTIVSLTLVGGTQHAVTQKRIDFWSTLYPGVTVLQELRKMAGWCDAKTDRRKTARGVEAFITSWLSKAQDQGPASAAARKGPAGSLNLLPPNSPRIPNVEDLKVVPEWLLDDDGSVPDWLKNDVEETQHAG